MMKTTFTAGLLLVVSTSTVAFHSPCRVQRRGVSLLMTQDDEDWRAFRAKLVMQSQKPSSTSTRNSLDDDADDVDGIGALFDTGGAWAYDSGNVIEEGAVILGGLDQEFGFGLRQQYFHKTVILVLEHDATFTKGIILNRPTNMYLDDDWRLAFGGDVHGNGDNPEIICLHSLQQEQVVQASRPVMKDIQVCTRSNGGWCIHD